MKKIPMVVLFMLAVYAAAGQSKQVKRYLEQIAANAAYREYLKKAIAIARTGLHTIGAIRNGEFKLHTVFFNGLRAVNPEVRHLAKVADIISLQVQVVQSSKSSYARLKASGQFTPQEMNYIHNVFSNLLDDCAAITGMLSALLTNGTYTMRDDERIRRIGELYMNMQRNYTFCQRFCNNNSVLAVQRLQEQKETAVLKNLFNTH